jgi:hypothetical protein
MESLSDFSLAIALMSIELEWFIGAKSVYIEPAQVISPQAA